MKSKKSLILLLALIVIIALLSGTFALDNVEGRSRNKITTGNVEIAISETSSADGGRLKGVLKSDKTGLAFTNVMPGQTASKVVTVRNDASACWLRVKVDTEITLADGSTDTAAVCPVSVNYNLTDWTKRDDGYYYYNAVVAQGSATKSLFSDVTFAADMGNDYAGCTVNVIVTAEAVQYANNSAANAWSAGGWPV